MSQLGIGVSFLTTPTPRNELRCLVAESVPFSSTIAGGFSVVRGSGVTAGLAAGLAAGAGAEGGSAGLLPLTLAGGFASAAGATAGISFLAGSSCSVAMGASFFSSKILVVAFSTAGFGTGAAFVAASMAAGVGSGIEAEAAAGVVVGVVVGAAVGAGAGSVAGATAGLNSFVATATFGSFLGDGAGEMVGLVATGDGIPSFFCVPIATLVARFLVTFAWFFEAGTKVGGAKVCSGDEGMGTCFGTCGDGDATALGLLMLLAMLRVGDGDVGGGGAVSPNNPNNLSVRGASRTRGDGCCILGVATAGAGDVGGRIISRVAWGLPTGVALPPPLLVCFVRVCGDGGTYPDDEVLNCLLLSS